MLTLSHALILTLILVCGQAQEESDVYYGKYLGELQSYHHQVGGEVYAVDRTTFHIKKFTYDGNGHDTFFWAGARPRPGPQGFLVPSEAGRTNVLGPYRDVDITIRLPKGKTITQIRWLAVYDLTRHEPFGDVYIPQGFEPPQTATLHAMKGRDGHVSSDPVVILDSKTIRMTNFDYDGSGQEVYFWVGVGPQPHHSGTKIPDELGYLTPLGRYHRATVTLTLPGDLTVLTLNWVAVYDVKARTVLGFVLLHDELNVPPSLVHITPHSTVLPQCEQLHRDLQVSWSVFGDQVTVELAARKELSEYLSFGISGDPSRPQMVGGDAVMLFRDLHQATIDDLNITSRFPCTELLKQRKGVCKDQEVGGLQDYQLMSNSWSDGVAVYTYRRRLTTADTGDAPYLASGPMMIIWAIGRLDRNNQAAMHRAWSKVAQPLDFGRVPSKNCFSFTHDPEKKITAWAPVKLTNTASRSFKVRLGPDGGPRGYEAITGNPSLTAKAWYVEDLLVPELYMLRNTEYKFLVEGGASPHDPANYHPFIITDEPHGGFSQLPPAEQAGVRVLAGVDYTQRGTVRPMRGGRLCEWRHPAFMDRRRDADVEVFAEYRNALTLHCEEDGGPSVLTLSPNKSWPATVYYNSWTGRNMGGRIHILDGDVDGH